MGRRRISNVSEQTEEQGKERFLICECLDGEMHAFPHPDITLRGLGDIVIYPNQPVIIDEIWLKSPGFKLAIDAGKIRVYESGNMPKAQDDTVPVDIDLTDSVLLNSANLILNGTFNEMARALIGVEPKDMRGGRTNIKYLKETQTAFLKYVLYKEERQRNRQEVIEAIKQRIEEIRLM